MTRLLVGLGLLVGVFRVGYLVGRSDERLERVVARCPNYDSVRVSAKRSVAAPRCDL